MSLTIQFLIQAGRSRGDVAGINWYGDDGGVDREATGSGSHLLVKEEDPKVLLLVVIGDDGGVDREATGSGSHLFVKEEEAKAVSDPLQLRDCVSDALDCSNLLIQELVHEVGKVRITLSVGDLGELQQALVHRLLQLKGSLHCLEAGAPLHRHRLGDVLEDTAATSLALVSHQLHPVLPLPLGLLGKVSRETGKGLVLPREVGRH